MALVENKDIRNIAIIAHVDHGKTTLVDGLLRQGNVFRSNQHIVERVMDSNDLERERGITILAKNTAVTYGDVKINIVDTPGHADFGGEVERVMNMVDGVLLLVDAVDGPMPQTRFVLRKALAMGHKVIVVVNKVDRPTSRPNFVTNATFDLFIELGASDEQAEFPIVYTNAIEGVASLAPVLTDADRTNGLKVLYDTIIDYVPGPRVDPDAPLQVLVSNLGYDDYKGRIAIGRITAGTVTKNTDVARIQVDGKITNVRIASAFTHMGMGRVESASVPAGDIVAITGIPDVQIGETIADKANPVPLPPIMVEEPTVRMMFSVNSSPFAGREGEFGTSRKLRERLYKELESNVSLRVEDGPSSDKFIVSGRGELHLVVLIETMRREGFEFEVGKPEVIFKEDANGKSTEPYEDVYVEVPEEFMGAMMEMLAGRQGALQNMQHGSSVGGGNIIVTLHYKIPTRGLLGFRGQSLTASRGTIVMNTLFAGYGPVMQAEIKRRLKGSLVAWEHGEAVTYGLRASWERGQLFIEAGTMVYEGMVVGEHIRPEDLDVNVCKTKILSAVRTRSSDHDTSTLPPIRQMSLDECIEFITDDEMVEVTPKSIRLRKRYLARDERFKAAKERKG